MTTDPVCLVYVDEALAETQGLSSEQYGRLYYFCSDECKHQFDRNPTTYIGQAADWQSTDMEGMEDYAG